MKRCIPRRVYSWPRKRAFRVSWGGLFLTIRLFPFRGWEAIACGRLGPPVEFIWLRDREEWEE